MEHVSLIWTYSRLNYGWLAPKIMSKSGGKKKTFEDYFANPRCWLNANLPT